MAGKKNLTNREVWWLTKKGVIEGRIYRNGKCKRVRQHRWIMEQYLGRELLPSEIIHHINHNRQDNRIDNFEIKTNGSHTSYHNLKRIYTKGHKNKISPEERNRRSEFMKEVHRRRKLNDPTNSWYARPRLH